MSYAHVVVGAGSSGVPLAVRLSADPRRRVLLIESGPDYPSVAETPAELLGRSVSEATIAHDWAYRAEARDGRMIEYPAGRITGGSSAINSAVALRGAPEDYDAWARATGENGWSYQELLPYLRRIEHDHDFAGPLHGDDGPIPIRRVSEAELLPVHRALREACLEAGFPAVADHNDPDSSGVGPWPRNAVGRVRISTALGYLTPEVRARPNLEIAAETTVHRVEFDHAKRVSAVVTVGPDGPRAIPARQVTLCAGAVATPAILIRSGIGARPQLERLGLGIVAEAPGVGAGLQDHPFTWLGVVGRDGVCDLDERSVQIGLRYTAPGSPDRNDMQLLVIVPVDLSHSPDLVACAGTERIFMIGAGLQRVYSRGLVEVDELPEAGALTPPPPRITVNIADDPRDLARLRDGLRLAHRLLSSPPLTPLVERVVFFDPDVLGDDDRLEEYVRGNAITFKHPSGSARMGAPGDPLAVTSPRGLVYGVQGLAVADASIMPAIPRANTNLTCIAIGERIADWLLEPLTEEDRDGTAALPRT